MKRCKKCNQVKPLSDFPKRKQCLDGHQNVCRECDNIRKREWEAKHPDRVDESKKRWYRDHVKESSKAKMEWARKHKETVKIAFKKYQDNHPDYLKRQRALSLKWHKAHPDKNRKSHKKWSSKNRDKINFYTQRRRATKRGNGGTYTQAEWESLCAKYDYKCLCCGQKKKLTPDHVIPVSKGGRSSIDNIQPLCLSCNTKKHSRVIDYR